LFESGVHGVKLLFEKIQSPERESTTIVLPTELVVRETTAPAVRS
jgi:DNA-binding LacI/PurR family transcriptional regulator